MSRHELHREVYRLLSQNNLNFLAWAEEVWGGGAAGRAAALLPHVREFIVRQ